MVASLDNVSTILGLKTIEHTFHLTAAISSSIILLEIKLSVFIVRSKIIINNQCVTFYIKIW